jgi:2-aminoethylphosphonate-pyruvate transaminase
MLLLNPGPVTLTERVRQSLLQPDLCHREPEFFDLQDEARERLVGVYALDPQDWQAVLMTGSGTAAIESMIAALVRERGRLLIVENGVYGERITQIACHYRIDYEVAKHERMQAPDIGAIAARLDAAARANQRFTHVAVVHHETTTGRLNDLAGVAAVCRERCAGVLVDGVSSFGAEQIDFADPAIVAIAGTANKCLHGVPGVSFVVARRASLKDAASRAYYLDLGRLARLQDERNTPFTPSVHAYYALVEALRELDDEGGWRVRYNRYRELAEQVRAGLARLGIASVLPPEQSSVVLRSYRLPRKFDYAHLHDTLNLHGFVIYAGQGGLSAELFRISTMGNLNAGDMDRLLSAFERLLA